MHTQFSGWAVGILRPRKPPLIECERMIGSARWLLCTALACIALAPAPAQLVLDRNAPAPYPMPPPKVEPEEEADENDGPPAYSGERIRLELDCDSDRLQAAGVICTPASPCEVWLELTAARLADEAVVVIGDLYTAAANLEGVVLRTVDGGSSWTEAAERLAATSLDELHFVDKDHGWALGREGVGGGQRPILLATDDAGRSWSRRYIDEDGDYRGEVLQLRFDSPDHGFAIVERAAGGGDPYEMRETFNGGRSWSLRQVTAGRPALPSSRRRILEPRARVREDSADNSLAIERREADEWVAAGLFEGLVGVCGP